MKKKEDWALIGVFVGSVISRSFEESTAVMIGNIALGILVILGIKSIILKEKSNAIMLFGVAVPLIISSYGVFKDNLIIMCSGIVLLFINIIVFNRLGLKYIKK